MSSPYRPVPNKQVQAFGLAICERLGIDPNLVGEQFHWEVTDGEELGRVDLSVYLPAQELLDMFNASGTS